MVFCGIYPADGAKYPELRRRAGKAAAQRCFPSPLTQRPPWRLALDSAAAFWASLHLEIIIERLEQEIQSGSDHHRPSVEYRITLTDGTVLLINNPPTIGPGENRQSRRALCRRASILLQEYTGSLMELCQNRRGVMRDMKYLDATRVDLHYELPWAKSCTTFLTPLNSRSRGYASYDYEMKGFQESNWSSWIFCSTAIWWTHCP